jgi:hypothetical protein
VLALNTIRGFSPNEKIPKAIDDWDTLLLKRAPREFEVPV